MFQNGKLPVSRPLQIRFLNATNKNCPQGAIFIGAGKGNRTPITSLENWSNNHYTIPAVQGMINETEADFNRLMWDDFQGMVFAAIRRIDAKEEKTSKTEGGFYEKTGMGKASVCSEEIP